MHSAFEPGNEVFLADFRDNHLEFDISPRDDQLTQLLGPRCEWPHFRFYERDGVITANAQVPHLSSSMLMQSLIGHAVATSSIIFLEASPWLFGSILVYCAIWTPCSLNTMSRVYESARQAPPPFWVTMSDRTLALPAQQLTILDQDIESILLLDRWTLHGDWYLQISVVYRTDDERWVVRPLVTSYGRSVRRTAERLASFFGVPLRKITRQSAQKKAVAPDAR